ncbi:hypothetical protein DFH27DRAFT_340249 [Peziza echinospora]|nr:hypothetical protein DFH27DRAFT_340249 [Peziza echinospora]
MCNNLSPRDDRLTTLWPPPNVDNPISRADSLRAGLVVAEALALAIIVLRLYTRVFVVRGLGLDDLLIGLASTLSIGTLCIALKGLSNGWGVHVWDLELDVRVQGSKFIYFAIVGFIPVTYLTKMSILLSYIRISPNIQFRNRVYALIIIITLSSFATLIPTIFQCTPISSSWLHHDPRPDSKCLDIAKLLMISTALNCLGDIAVAALPAPMLLKANLPKKEQYGLILLFAIAGVVCLIGIARGVTLHDTLYNVQGDFTWGGGTAVILGGVECNAGMIAASLPALRPFWSQCFSRKHRSSQNIEEITSRKDRAGESQMAAEPDLENGNTQPREGAPQHTNTANEEGQKSFFYAATIAAPKSRNSEIRGSMGSFLSSPVSAINPFRSLDSAVKKSRRRSSIEVAGGSATTTAEMNGNEGWRASTGRTWLSLEEEEEEEEGEAPQGVQNSEREGYRPHTSPWQESIPIDTDSNLPLKKSRSEAMMRAEHIGSHNPSLSPSLPRRDRKGSVEKSESGFSYASTPITPTVPSRTASASSSRVHRHAEHESLNVAISGNGGFCYATTASPSPTTASPSPTKPLNLTTALISSATAAAAAAITIPLSTKKSTATLNTITACSSDSGADDPQTDNSRRWYGLSTFSKVRGRGSTFDSTETFKLGDVDQNKKRTSTSAGH